MFLVFAAATAFSLFGNSPQLKSIGYDPFNISGVEDSAAVGPVMATSGALTVSLFQIGRFSGDAAAGMAAAVSYDGGNSWRETVLPNITRATGSSNPYDRVTYESIAYDQKYGVFVGSMLPISNVAEPQYGETDTTLPPIVVRSSDGVNWSAPIAVSTGAGEIRPEKNYIACDNNLTSHYYGNCYEAWDDNDNNDAFHAAVSTNGGQTWGPTVGSANGHSSFGGQPIVMPNGTVVVVSEDSSGYDGTEQNIISFISTNGGASWSAAYEVAPITTHAIAGSVRSQSLPTTAVDSSGLIYTIWQDCRFRSGCSSNDLVISESRNGAQWSAPYRIPLDSPTSGADHFLPTLAVQNGVFGPTLGLSYYGYPQANCGNSCGLYAYYASYSWLGGSWSAPTTLVGPMPPSYFAATGAGYMLGDYFESTFTLAGYVAPLVIAGSPSGSPSYHEYAIDSVGLSAGLFAKSAGGFRSSLVSGTGMGADAMKVKQFNPAHIAPWRKLPHKQHNG